MDILDSLMAYPEFVALALLLIGLGIASGFLAGMLGIGGGIVLVPGLYFVFTRAGFAGEGLMQVCLGTSLAVIAITGISSTRAHLARGGVQIPLVQGIGGGILVGVVVASVIAGQVSSDFLQMFFAGAIAVLAVVMWSNPAKKLAVLGGEYHRPSLFSRSVAGLVIGLVSSLIGVGGATMSVPYMRFYHVPLHRAVGTASALGLVIAVPAAVGYVIAGWKVSGLPLFSFGYVNILAWAVIVPFSFLMAPVGAHVAYKLPVCALRKVFALFMLVVAVKMGLSIMHG